MVENGVFCTDLNYVQMFYRSTEYYLLCELLSVGE